MRALRIAACIITLGLSVACSSESDDAASGVPSAAGGTANLGPETEYGPATGGSSLGSGGTLASGPSIVMEGDMATEAPANSGDRYDAPGTNPFVLVAHDPLSTFAADVDTASYDVFRRDVAAGVLPQPDSVRLEEYVNYFDYAYPAPAADSEVPFSISLAAASNIVPRETVLFRVGIQGALPPPETRRPANLVFLIDTSGSMSSSDKLPLVQYTLTEALDVLSPTDTIAIVTYAGSTEVRLAPTPVSERVRIEAVIQGLASGGSTAGAAGLTLAYEQAQAGFIEGGVNHVLLCTDGDFNVGTSSTQELVSLIEEKRETGVTLTVLGYGTGNLNDGMMEAISNKGNGVYGVIVDQDSATEYVNERLLSTMHFIAKDMKIQVEFNPAHVFAYRLLGYENRAIADDQFRDDSIDAGEVGAGHRVTALYELVLAGAALPAVEGAPPATDGAAFSGVAEVNVGDVALVKVRYKAVDATELDPAFEVSAPLAAESVAADYSALDADFQWAAAVATFAEILKDSPYADPTSLPALETIVTRPVFHDDPDRAEFARLFGLARPLLE